MEINNSNRDLFYFLILFIITCMMGRGDGLRFHKECGEFKILQVADMHYANGPSTVCVDVFPEQNTTCSDLNTTAFLHRILRAENPDLVVFTGDNIFGPDTIDPIKSMDMAFAPVVELKYPWAAVLGNHDQQNSPTRESVMRHIISMPHTVSRLNPDGIEIDGFGNYNLEIEGPEGSPLVNKSVLNLYFVDSGDFSNVSGIPGLNWIQPSQEVWFQKTSLHLQKRYKSAPNPQNESAPGLVYFHIPLLEYNDFDSSNFTGVRQKDIASAEVNSGFFATMAEAGDVKAAFIGHDHTNDYCGNLTGIQLCYAGGFGYHAYGKAGWPRRTRVVSAILEKTADDQWGGVQYIKTWKRLDDEDLTMIDPQVLWNKASI